jgi:alkylation response protein AidB-like acyl-CoA dehydrogenase
LTYFLVPLDAPGVTVRGFARLDGDEGFAEVWFDDVFVPDAAVLGGVGEGWKVAMATLGFERGTAFMSQQLGFERELGELIELARENGSARDPVIRDRLARHYAGVQIMRYNGQRMLTDLVTRGVIGPQASIGKLYWTSWHRDLGETAMTVLGTDALTVAGKVGGDYELDELHHTFMASRAETIYAGSSEIQRNIIGERVLGLPREPR